MIVDPSYYGVVPAPQPAPAGTTTVDASGGNSAPARQTPMPGTMSTWSQPAMWIVLILAAGFGLAHLSIRFST